MAVRRGTVLLFLEALVLLSFALVSCTKDDASSAGGPALDDGSVLDATARVDARVEADSSSMPFDASSEAVVDAGDAGEDAPAVVDARTNDGPIDTSDAASDPAGLWASPALPPFDAATVAHVRDLQAHGVAAGARDGVFAKVGDSITASSSFLVALGEGPVALDSYKALSATIGFFTATSLSDASNAFTRTSLCAIGGSSTADALKAPSPLNAELSALHPAYAIVMYGTNDLGERPVDAFVANMNVILDRIEAAQTVPIMSTIPPRTDYADAEPLVTTFNAAIRNLAASRHEPLVDLYVGLTTLPSRGLSIDGVHPSVPPGDGGSEATDFTAAGLQYGYDVRNLLTLQVLDRLRQIR
jgi:hypothetical protein